MSEEQRDIGPAWLLALAAGLAGTVAGEHHGGQLGERVRKALDKRGKLPERLKIDTSSFSREFNPLAGIGSLLGAGTGGTLGAYSGLSMHDMLSRYKNPLEE